MKRQLLFVTALTLWALPGLAEDAITIAKPWARATILISRPGVVYLAIKSRTDDRLIGLETPVAASVMIHAAETTDGVSHMVQLMSLALPAEQTVMLAPGGVHLMLMGLKAKLAEGDSFPLTLRFEHAGTVTVEVPVQGIAALGPEAGQ